MNCHETRHLVHAYLDGELDLMTALALEDHLERCASCALLHREQRALKNSLGLKAAFHRAPGALSQRVRRDLGRLGWLSGIPWWQTWRLTYVPGALLVALLAWNLLPHSPFDPETVVTQRQAKLVYHVNASSNVSTALRNLANLLDASPGVRVVVVANDAGIDFLLAGARDAEDKLFEPAVARLKERGVDFRVCGNTLGRRQINSSQVIPEARLVPSGIAEISRLQSLEGYAYMKL